MSDQDRITAILQAVQDDAKLIALLRISVNNNLPNVPSAQLRLIMSLLGIPDA